MKPERRQTIADKKRPTGNAWLQDVFQQDAELAREAIRKTVQDVLEEGLDSERAW